MNKPLLCYFLGLFLLACTGRATRATVKTDTVVAATADEPSASAGAALDSSMVSLKTFQTISLEDAMSQRWIFDDADKSHWDKIFWDSVTNTRQYPELAMFPDHSALMNLRCGPKMGRWNLDKENGEMSLLWKDGSADLFIVRQRALRQMELAWHRGGDLALVRLKSDAIVHRRKEEDPYYPTNNRWRIKPVARESKDQLRTRAKECVLWYSLFFLDNHRRRATEISYSGLPCCFEWYNGAIGMQSRADLDKRWVACFYSEDQAFTAYDIISDELGKKRLKWPEHPTSWVRQTGEVLQQLADHL